MVDTTHTQELIEFISANSPKVTDTIKEILDSWNPAEMDKGARYYRNETDVVSRTIYRYEGESKVPDTEATNEKVPSGMHKILVDQKTAYLAGEPMKFGSKRDNEKQLELLEEIIGEKWEDTLPELIKGASNKGLEWLHPFVDEEGEFDYMIVPAENVIPIYNPQFKNQLLAAIRFYYVADDHAKIMVYTEEDVTFYELLEGKVILDATVEMNPQAHFYTLSGEAKSWGMVPFIKFANNEEELSDLHFNKRAIDAYEFLVSDAQNTLTDMQSVILALKGYEGEDLAGFMTNLRRYKAIKLEAGEGHGVSPIKIEVPTDAYKLQAEMVRKNIITSGQGVDPSPEVIGTAPSGVALEHLYSLLDMKASMLERKFTLALRVFMHFIEIYCQEAKKGDFDYRDVTFTFNKMLLTNEAEIIQMASNSVGIISNATIVENHPWVKDVAQEQQRLADEKAARENNLPPIEDEFGGNEDKDDEA